MPSQPEKTINISRRHHWFPREMTSEKRAQKLHTMKRHCPDLVSTYNWPKQIFHAARPIRSTNQIWVVTRHQYGISALVCTSFRRETSGSVAKCGLFSQAVAISKKQQTTRNCFTHPKCIFNNKTLPLFKEFNLLEDMFYQHKLFSLTFRLVNNKF